MSKSYREHKGKAKLFRRLAMGTSRTLRSRRRSYEACKGRDHREFASMLAATRRDAHAQ